MAQPTFKGVVNIDIKDSVADWGPYAQPMAHEGAPNVLYIVLDDVGFSAMEPYGGVIETPNINRMRSVDSRTRTSTPRRFVHRRVRA